MKKLLGLLLAAILLFSSACAETFPLDENAVLPGMNGRSWARGYAPDTAGDTLTLCLPIAAGEAQGRITVSLLPADESISPFMPQSMETSCWPSGGIYPATLKLKLFRSRTNGDYPATVLVTGTDTDGNAVESRWPLMIRIRDGAPQQPQRPAWTDVAAALTLGEDCTLTAKLSNTAPAAEMTDILLTVTDTSGDILMSGSDKLALGDLLPGESREIAVPLSVRPTADVSLHTLTFTLTFTALEQSGSWEESFTLPVTQAIRLEHGGIQLPATALQGDLTTLILPLMNMGKAELQNVLVTLELPGIADKQSVLVGPLAPGETKQAKLTFLPGRDAQGHYAGTASVTCEDACGNTAGFTLPVEIAVEKAADPAHEQETEKEADTTGNFFWLMVIICAVLLILLAVQGSHLNRKIRRMEEDRL